MIVDFLLLLLHRNSSCLALLVNYFSQVQIFFREDEEAVAVFGVEEVDQLKTYLVISSCFYDLQALDVFVVNALILTLARSIISLF